MLSKKCFAIMSVVMSVLASCRTVNFENETLVDTQEVKLSSANNRKQEAALNAIEDEEWEYQEELRREESEVKTKIVYVEKPVYVPELPEREVPVLTGKDAVKSSTEGAIQQPSKFKNGAMIYDYDETFTYEIFCQAYRVTDLMLEPGEQVLEMPFLSENQVWEIGAGVSRSGNTDVQHFFLKPSMSGLTTSMIIITDKRVYHLLLKSYKDAYMSIVQWNYPGSMPFTVMSGSMTRNPAVKNASSYNERNASSSTGIDPRFLSFDYKMSYSIFHKPIWLPTLVFDDGAKTYIRMNETMLHRESPVIFNKKNELLNYRVDANLMIIDGLIDKITIKRSKEKVVVRKLSYKPTEDEVEVDEKKDKPVEFQGVKISSSQAEEARRNSIPKKESPEVIVEYKASSVPAQKQ